MGLSWEPSHKLGGVWVGYLSLRDVPVLLSSDVIRQAHTHTHFFLHFPPHTRKRDRERRIHRDKEDARHQDTNYYKCVIRLVKRPDILFYFYSYTSLELSKVESLLLD